LMALALVIDFRTVKILLPTTLILILSHAYLTIRNLLILALIHGGGGP